MNTTAADSSQPVDAQTAKPVTELSAVTVRLAGDSGDGMQLAGSQLANTSALNGNDIATFPDFPAEIRAPRGTLAGVSGFQMQFSSNRVFTPGDRLDALVAMNPAALKENLADLKPSGVLIVDDDSFGPKDLKLAGYDSNPIESGGLDGYQLVRAPITELTRGAVAGTGIGRKLATRCRNFFALGLLYWLYGRPMEPTRRFIEQRFGKDPEVVAADTLAMEAGWSYGETTEALERSHVVPKADLEPGLYRSITGNQAIALGLVAAASRSGKQLFYGSYPITPASDILHSLSRHKNFGVRTFQAEDEIAAVTASIGAAFGGAMAATASAGPGIALKTEAIGLAVALELPMLVISVQRGGPSTGLPTKPEQTDLLQVLFGRSGESPIPVLAAKGPADCFDTIQEAWRLAVRLMTPVVVLSDAYIANAAEPWRIPSADSIEPAVIRHPEERDDGKAFLPYARDEMLARPWALPGTKGLTHRIGGLEKEDVTGNISYHPENHEHMTRVRARKVDNAADLIGPLAVDGPDHGRLLVLSWGGTFGACSEAVSGCRARGADVSHAHLRHMNPFPRNLQKILEGFDRVLIPELNTGQLKMLIQARYLVSVDGLNKIKGRPFSSNEIADKIVELL